MMLDGIDQEQSAGDFAIVEIRRLFASVGRDPDGWAGWTAGDRQAFSSLVWQGMWGHPVRYLVRRQRGWRVPGSTIGGEGWSYTTVRRSKRNDTFRYLIDGIWTVGKAVGDSIGRSVLVVGERDYYEPNRDEQDALIRIHERLKAELGWVRTKQQLRRLRRGR